MRASAVPLGLAGLGVLIVTALTPTAQAKVPEGLAFSDLAPFSDVSCVRDGRVVARDLIVNPGGGNVAWLPDGTQLIGTLFEMYDDRGNLLLHKSNGGRTRQAATEVVCTTVGTDPDTGHTVTVIFSAAAVGD